MVEVKKIDGISVVGLSGELSRQNINVLEDTLESLSMCDERNIVLNLSSLEHLDYRLVKRIAEHVIEFQCDGGDLKMAAASRYIKKIFEAMGLDEEVYSSVEDALMDFVYDAPGREAQ